MPDTSTWRLMRGLDADWTVEVAMQANILHALQVANWQRGADAKEAKARKHYPQPLMSPSERAKKTAAAARPAESIGRLLQFKKRTGYAEREA
jgi:hypothetical protein